MDTNEQLENDMKHFLQVSKANAELRYGKVQKYGIAAYEQGGVYGICMRLQDKLSRIMNYYNAKHSGDNDKLESYNKSDESIRDTLCDLSNYAIMGIMILDKEFARLMKKTNDDTETNNNNKIRSFNELYKEVSIMTKKMPLDEHKLK